jgi:hypothetical protein
MTGHSKLLIHLRPTVQKRGTEEREREREYIERWG